MSSFAPRYHSQLASPCNNFDQEMGRRVRVVHPGVDFAINGSQSTRSASDDFEIARGDFLFLKKVKETSFSLTYLLSPEDY